MEKNEQNSSRLCQKCNTFYGNASTNYLCSSCFKKTNESQKLSTAQAKKESINQPKQADPSRCYKCHKNVGLLGIPCKCDYIFCNKHRMPEEHQCGVDYRKIGKQQLKKQYKTVAASKVDQI